MRRESSSAAFTVKVVAMNADGLNPFLIRSASSFVMVKVLPEPAEAVMMVDSMVMRDPPRSR